MCVYVRECTSVYVWVFAVWNGNQRTGILYKTTQQQQRQQRILTAISGLKRVLLPRNIYVLFCCSCIVLLNNSIRVCCAGNMATPSLHQHQHQHDRYARNHSNSSRQTDFNLRIWNARQTLLANLQSFVLVAGRAEWE